MSPNDLFKPTYVNIDNLTRISGMAWGVGLQIFVGSAFIE